MHRELIYQPQWKMVGYTELLHGLVLTDNFSGDQPIYCLIWLAQLFSLVKGQGFMVDTLTGEMDKTIQPSPFGIER